VLETEVDDMTGELLGHVLEEALRRGALDVNFTPVQMKKNRPGTRLTLLCEEADRDRFLDFIFRETSSLGVRIRSVQRAELERDTVTGELAGLRFRVKRGLGTDGEVLNEAPEFEELKAVARQEGKPLKRLLQKWFGREVQRDDQ
jgi:uncharacterized protein (DUF111 family)